MDAATIEHEALALNPAERAALADRLLQTLDKASKKKMHEVGKEAEARLASFEQGRMSEVDGPTAVAQIRKQLG